MNAGTILPDPPAGVSVDGKLLRRPKSPFRLQLESLQPGQELTIHYSDRKTPFSVLMAIKRKLVGKHFIFEEMTPGIFRVWIGSVGQRSKSLRRVASIQTGAAA